MPKTVKDMSAHLNSYLQLEISKLANENQLNKSLLEEFAKFVINNHKKKEPKSPSPKKPKSLTLTQIKSAVFQHFSVENVAELKKSGAFTMATDGLDISNLKVKKEWEALYRKFIGILPGEEGQEGYGCINGINVFNYFRPWQVFNLNPEISTSQDIKNAYYKLSKIYHPDVPDTGDAKIFDCLTIMYKSISAEG